MERILIPILVVPSEKDSRCQRILKHFGDDVYELLQVNAKRLAETIEMVLSNVHYDVMPSQTDDQWAKSGYSPTPTIIEVAIALYEENTVEDITKHGGDIDKASVELCKIIDHCRTNNRKAICFITGVPGAGKTLIGLNTAIDQFNRGEKAVYLSGNFPLVEVLQEALTRDREPSIHAIQSFFWSVVFVFDGDFLLLPKFVSMINGGSEKFRENGWHGMYVLSAKETNGRIYPLAMDFEIFKSHALQAAEQWQKRRQWFDSKWMAE